jgi:murein DD-endopeptidase MepM/ murein hydrolase activator NlpD
MNRTTLRIAIYTVVAVAGAAALISTIHARAKADAAFAAEVRAANELAERIAAEVVLYSGNTVKNGATLADSLRQMGLEASVAARVAGSAQLVFDLRHFHAGNLLAIGRSVKGVFRGVRYQIDTEHMLFVEPRTEGYRAWIDPIPIHTEIATVSGTIRNSLFNAVTDTGESPELAIRMAEIFGWDLDFYTDPRLGDKFRLLVEKKTYANGQTASYGKILAAEYDNGNHPYQAVLFHDASGTPAFYKPDGGALQKAFLRSPLKFAAPISSHFSQSRFHPILKIYRPHLGVDYAAPTGTPVQSIGAGKVTFAAKSGGGGNTIHVQHSNGYQTMYMHLSRILVHVGERVEAGQRIGLVGMTGLATGPHLDFRVLQNGAYRDFETLHLPPAEPVARKDMTEFASARDRWMPLLNKDVALVARAH